MSINLRIAPLILFVLFSLKFLVLGGSLADASILAVLALGAGYFDYKQADAEYKKLQEHIEAQNEVLARMNEQLQETRDRVNSIKLGNQLKIHK